MCISSPLSALFALLGSVICVLTAMGLGADASSIYAGLWGFSGALTAIAIGGIFIYMNKLEAFLYFVLASISTVIIHGATIAYLL